MGYLNILFLIASAQNNLPSGLLNSLCYVESAHNPAAVHRDDGNGNSVGLCQIKIATAKGLGYKGTEKGLLDPQVNIQYSAKYLSHQIKRYGSVEKGVIAYNRGNAKDLITSKYQIKVFKQWKGKNVKNQRSTPRSIFR